MPHSSLSILIIFLGLLAQTFSIQAADLSGDLGIQGLSTNIRDNQIILTFDLPPEILLASELADGTPGHIHATGHTDLYYDKEQVPDGDDKQVPYIAFFSEDKKSFYIFPKFHLSPGKYRIYIQAGGIRTTDPLVLLRRSCSIPFELLEEHFTGLGKRLFPIAEQASCIERVAENLRKKSSTETKYIAAKKTFYCQECKQRFPRKNLLSHDNDHIYQKAQDFIAEIVLRGSTKTSGEAERIRYELPMEIKELPTPQELAQNIDALEDATSE